MSRRTIVAIFVLASLAGACSQAKTGAHGSRAGVAGDVALGTAAPASPAPDVHRLRIDWSTTLTGEPGGLATDDRGVVTAETERGVTALDTHGQVVWSTPLAGAGLGWPWLGDGSVVVPTAVAHGSGGCVALDRDNGDVRWSYTEPGENGVAVAVAGDEVICVTGNGVVVALDLATGARRWRMSVYANPAGHDDTFSERTAIAVDTTSGIVALTARFSHWVQMWLDLGTGADRGGLDLGTGSPPSAPVSVSPGRLAFGASNPSEVCEVDLRKRRIDRCVSVRAPGGFDPASVPIVDAGHVLVTTRDGSLVDADVLSKKVEWSARAPRPILDAHPAVSSGVVLYSDLTRVPLAVRLRDGAPVALPPTDGWVVSTVADPHGGFVVAHRSLDAGWIERWVPAG